MKKELLLYSKYNDLPDAETNAPLLPGCMILEGGGWRCLYTQGALDAIMEEGINLQTVIGVSAGAMSSLAYASGQIGMSARINLKYRHDPDYCGLGSIRKEHGMTGFKYFFHKIIPESGYDWNRISPERRVVAVAANCITGKAEYFEYGRCNFEKAVAASATVPYVSRPVVILKTPYLDGGCADRIPYRWALDQGYEKIVVIRTRDRNYRKNEGEGRLANDLFYRSMPKLRDSLNRSASEYNTLLERLYADESAGKVFMLAPKQPVEVSRFEKDMEKLGALYETGYSEMKEKLGDLKRYLGI